jgi:hypothetical protein
LAGRTTGLALATALTLCCAALQTLQGAQADAAPQVGATFYSWYDHPKAGFAGSDGRDLLRDHFVAPERVHAGSPDWYAGELAVAADAGLDLLLFASVAPPDPERPWTAALAAALEATRGRLARPVRAALLLEPWGLVPARTGAGGSSKLDLAEPAQLAKLVDAVPDFFRAIKPEDWARIDGAPLVVVGSIGSVAHAPEDLFGQIERRAKETLGVAPHLVVDATWQQPQERYASWREGSPVLGVQTGRVASLAPGFDERQIDHPREIVRPREGGRAYEAAWQELFAKPPRLVVIESWNQMHDGSAIAPTLEHGRRYVDLTRRYAERLRLGEGPGERVVPRFDTVVGMAEYAEDRRFSTLDEVSFRPGEDDGGVVVATDCDAALDFVATKAGDRLVAAPRGEAKEGVVRLDVTPVFPAAGAERFTATLRFAARDRAAGVDVVGWPLPEPDHAPTDAKSHLFASAAAEAGRSQELKFELDAPDLRPSKAPDRRASLELRFHGGPIEVEELAIRRVDHRLSEGGEPAPFHRIVLRWRELEPTAGVADDAAIAAALRKGCEGGQEEVQARFCGLVVVSDAPPWAVPLGAHSFAAASFVRRVVAAMAGRPQLRLLELFPAPNVAGEFGRGRDPMGYVRVLRAVAAVAHEDAPHLALTLGAIRGPDVAWLETIQKLRQPFVFDAATFELDDESGIPGDATCERQFERLLAQWRRGGDGEKPFFLQRRGWTTGGSLLELDDRFSLVPELVGVAWKRLARDPGPIDVLDPEALPLVRGQPTAVLLHSLRKAGLNATAHAEPELLDRLAAGSVATLLLGQGELVPERLAGRLVDYVDGGGLLACLGGAPFRRVAVRLPTGGYLLDDESSIGMELRDDLRIDVVAHAPAESVAVVPASAPELLRYGGLTLPSAAIFARRAGRPRDPNLLHRYETLLATARDGVAGGDLAALITYSGARKGALLLIGLDGGGRRLTEEQVRDAEKSLREIARRHGAAALFLLPGDARR